MPDIYARLKTEPALVMAALEALIALVVAFGLDLSGEQVAAVLGIVAVLTGVQTRRKVTPTVAPRLDDGHGDAT